MKKYFLAAAGALASFAITLAVFSVAFLLGAETPGAYRIQYLEARVAYAETLAMLEQSLTPRQRELWATLNKHAGAVAGIEKLLQKACIEQGQILAPGRGVCLDAPAAAEPAAAKVAK